LSSAEQRELLEKSGHGEVPVAEDVAASGAAALERAQVSLRHVVDVDDVHAGVDVSVHSSLEKIADHGAGGRGLDVAAADREGWMHDPRIEAVFSRFADQRFGLPLALLVRARRRSVGHRIFVGDTAVVDAADSGDAAAIDEARTARARGFEDVPGAAD